MLKRSDTLRKRISSSNVPPQPPDGQCSQNTKLVLFPRSPGEAAGGAVRPGEKLSLPKHAWNSESVYKRALEGATAVKRWRQGSVSYLRHPQRDDG